jgi:signal transduction histidine kinase
LWSERGLIGLLLLGEKSDHGNYSLEEIEIARASGERLADVLTSAEIARRLIHLQRQRLMESSVLDRRAHRMLHDDVLPHLHTVLLQLGTLPTTSNPPAQDAIDLLTRIHRQISDLLRDLPGPPSMGLARLGLVNALHRVIEDELSTSFDEVIWQVETEVESRARDLPALAAEVLYAAAREAIRNAARHARSQEDSRSLRLTFKMYWRAGVEIQIEDNGVGLPASGVRSSDNGHGLALHSTMMAVINGSLSLESAPGGFTRVVLNLPESAFATWIQSDPVTGQ